MVNGDLGGTAQIIQYDLLRTIPSINPIAAENLVVGSVRVIHGACAVRRNTCEVRRAGTERRQRAGRVEGSRGGACKSGKTHDAVVTGISDEESLIRRHCHLFGLIQARRKQGGSGAENTRVDR